MIPAGFEQASGAGTKKTQNWFRGAGGGRTGEESCTTLQLQRKKLENINAPLKILKLKGNNRTETHYFKTRWFRVIPDFEMRCEGLRSVEILCS